MRRRWRLWLALALLLLVGASLLHPTVHWLLIGWYRGEAFCLGRPSSYWLQELRKSHWLNYFGGGSRAVDPKPAWAPEALRPLWGSRVPGLEVLEADPAEAVPVLREVIELAGDETEIDRLVQFIAQSTIDQWGQEAMRNAAAPGP